MRQQAAVAELGQRALSRISLSQLEQDAAARIAEILAVEYVAVFEYLPDERTFLLAAGVGWQAGLVSYLQFDVEAGSQAGYTLLSGEPMIVEDWTAEQRLVLPPLLQRHNVVSSISVVVHGQRRPFGILSAHSTSPRAFNRDDINFLQAIANVLSAVAERRQAELELEQRVEQLQHLYQLSEALSRAASIEEICDAALAGLQRTLGIDRASVLLLDRDGVMRFKAWLGLSDDYRRAVEGHSPWLPDVLDPQPLLISDVTTEQTLQGYHELFRAERIAALGFIPLVYQGRLLGKFMLYYRTPHQFSTAEVQLAQTIASQIAFAIERRRGEDERSLLLAREQQARAEAERAAEMIRRLQSITDAALTCLTLEDLFSSTLSRVCELLHCDISAILLMAENGRELVPRASIGLEEEIWGGQRIPLGQGFAGSIAATGKPLVVEDVSSIEIASPILRASGVRSLLGVPLFFKDRVTGVLHVGSFQIRRFTQEEIHLLLLVADRIGLSIEQARLYEAERAARQRAELAQQRLTELTETLNRALAEAELLNAIATATAGESDLGRILSAALDQLSHLIAFTGGSIALIEADELVIRAAVGRFAAQVLGQRLPRRPGRSWKTVESGEPFFSNDLLAEGIRTVSVEQSHILRSYIAVPLVWYNEVFGLLEIDSVEPHAFQPADLTLIRAVAALLSGPIALARRYAAEVETRERVEALAAERSAILQQITEGVIIAGPDGSITFVNDAARRIHGGIARLGVPIERYTEAYNLFTCDGRPYPPEALPLARAVSAGETVMDAELCIHHSDGSRAIISASATPVIAEDGRQLGAVLVVRDITAQRALERQKDELLQARDRALAEAIQAQSRLAFLAEASVELATSLDYETTLQRVARLAVPTLADCCAVDVLEEDGAIHPVATVHFDPIKEQQVQELRRRYPTNPTARHGIAHVLRRAVPKIIPEITDTLLESNACDTEHLAMLRGLGFKSGLIVPIVARGRTLGAITFIMAESGRRYDEDDLALAEELARRAAVAIDNARLYHESQEALKIRDQFLSIAAHELKTPITALLGYTQLLQRRAEREGSADERNVRALHSLSEQAQRLNRLINALLDISRIRTGQFTIERERVDITALARRMVEELQPTLEHHRLEFRAPAEPLFAEGDELRLEQVLQNLLQNAVKYSPNGGLIQVIVDRQDAEVRIAVVDQGIGIPEESLPKLFTRFYRASNVSGGQISGMGIGLYVVKEIIALHGGRLGVESIEGKGSTFTVYLPLIQ
ncbi:MAG: hypothetical protein KatS3mg057_2927 [Herpetosiphonaceae bacterium]|nr:MAG: hypothetical protein KatS3mg057_2927 [Herpetosiphonaceae bacterium]